MSLISIITAVYNNKHGLKVTLESVLRQKAVSIELIVIDGGSTDGTLDIIKDLDNHIDYWVSEPDNGVFDAMNKGIEVATGDWVNFLNSGDTLELDVLSKIDFDIYYNYSIIYGNVVKDNGVEYPYIYNKTQSDMPCCHQAMFFNTNRVKDVFFYDKRFPLLADYDLFKRVLQKGTKIKWIDEPIVYYESGGLSSIRGISSIKSRFNYLIRYEGLLGLLKYILVRLKILKFNIKIRER